MSVFLPEMVASLYTNPENRSQLRRMNRMDRLYWMRLRFDLLDDGLILMD